MASDVPRQSLTPSTPAHSSLDRPAVRGPELPEEVAVASGPRAHRGCLHPRRSRTVFRVLSITVGKRTPEDKEAAYGQFTG